MWTYYSTKKQTAAVATFGCQFAHQRVYYSSLLRRLTQSASFWEV